MPKRSLPIILVLVIAGFATNAQVKHQAGVRLGSYDQIVSTGFTYRYHFSENKAVEAILNLRDPLAVGALYEVFKPISAVPNLQWFYGGGAFVGFKGIDNFGITGIAGVDYQFTGVPVNLSIDWKPELSFIQDVRFRASTVAVSVRFAFPSKK